MTPEQKKSCMTLEAARNVYKLSFPVRDGFTCEQQIAMSLLHNCDVMGKGWQSMLVMMQRQTIRSLVRKGVIDDRGRLTKSGNNLLKKWAGYK